MSALGNCISALSEKKRHIPFRDSKLTRLLQDSLGGNARTALVINISPCDADASESLSSLSFGQRAMAVATRAHRNIEIDYKALYATVQNALDEKDDEIRRLEITQSKSGRQIEMLLNQLGDAKLIAQRAEMEMKMLRTMQSNNTNNSNNNDPSPSKKGMHDGSPSTKNMKNLSATKESSLSSDSNPCNRPVSGGMADGGLENAGLFGLTAVADAPEDDSVNHDNNETPEIGGVIEEIPWNVQLDQLRSEYQEQITIQQSTNAKTLKDEKNKRLSAEEEWNRIEYDLRGEREEHLRTCIQLKECRLQINKLDRETTDRIGELKKFKSSKIEISSVYRCVIIVYTTFLYTSFSFRIFFSVTIAFSKLIQNSMY